MKLCHAIKPDLELHHNCYSMWDVLQFVRMRVKFVQGSVSTHHATAVTQDIQIREHPWENVRLKKYSDAKWKLAHPRANILLSI